MPSLASCLLAAVVLLSTGPAVLAQGFNAFSGRNHPELDWQVAETEHFEIMYPARLAGIEGEAAPIAEASYDALSANLGVTFEDRIRIYLSDEDEITNGFAVPIGGGYTNIWVHVNDAAGIWTGEAKWLRKVIAHELAHIFHFRATRSNLGLLAYLFSEPMPSFWAEGFAQYQTERWDAQRGDRWLRTAVLEDRLSYTDRASLWNGRLLYAVGNAQARFFAEQYGDSTLAKLLRHRKKELFGLVELHDFKTALKATTKKPYRQFYDDWRRHVNVYYNTLAGQMETLDSLHVDPLRLPGQYVYDVRYSPDTTRVAVLALESLDRPVRRLYVRTLGPRRHTRIVAEGDIPAPVAWSPDGARLAFARTERGAYGSFINDLYLADAKGRGTRRLTRNRRATSPTFAPDGRRLAFIASERGTANVFVLDLETGAETQLTAFTGDVQLATVRWHPREDRLALDRFDANGRRDLVLLDPATGRLQALTPGEADDRRPVWSPDGRHLAFTSLRDEVPNVFVLDLEAALASAGGIDQPEMPERRVTRLAVGATVYDWLPPDSARSAGSLILAASASKTRDTVYRIDAARTAADSAVTLPEPYAAWTEHRPPHEIPFQIPPDSSLITRRYPYNAWKNLSHVISYFLPYYGDPTDYGFFGLTAWTEPLGKHTLFFLGAASIPTLRKNSLLFASYVNNQFYPTLVLSAYRLPGNARYYGSEVLVEDRTGGTVTGIWPVDLIDVPYSITQFYGALSYLFIRPSGLFGVEGQALPPPESGRQVETEIGLYWKKQRPYRFNVIHPLDGLGARAEVTLAGRVLGGETAFVRPEVAAFGIFPALGLQRLYLYGRAQARFGAGLAQDYIGFSRYDNLDVLLPGYVPLVVGDAERVRGYRRHAYGNRVLFGSAEYRMPLPFDLQTKLLGFLELGRLSLTAFADAGMVWNGSTLAGADRRLGLGLELKNMLSLGGLDLLHAVGVAQPRETLGDFSSRGTYEIYYRLQAAVPF